MNDNKIKRLTIISIIIGLLILITNRPATDKLKILGAFIIISLFAVISVTFTTWVVIMLGLIYLFNNYDNIPFFGKKGS